MSNVENNDLPGEKAVVLDLIREKRLAEALAACRQICAKEPGEAGNWYMLASIQGRLGQFKEAINSYDAVLQRQPDHMLAWFSKGTLLESIGDANKAGPCYRKALVINTDFAPAWFGLGNLQFKAGDGKGAEDSYLKAIKFKPDYIEALSNLGKLLQFRYQYTAAETYFRKALEYTADSADLYNELGLSLNGQGNVEAAEQAFRQALAIKPDFYVAGSNLLLTMNYTVEKLPGQIFAEHLRHGRFIREQTPGQPDFQHDADAGRRLRVGYISADFRDHSVACFFLALLEYHNYDEIDAICYSDVKQADAVTEHMQGLSTHWRGILGLTDAQVAELVRVDSIDILVDLTGHTPSNRMPVFAARAAPVQVTMVGYPNTTGLKEMDYRITDAQSDPPGTTDAGYTETLYRLPGCFLCYTPPADAPLPTKEFRVGDGGVTFGCFNSFFKLSAEVYQVWADILKAVPDSRLLLKNFSLSDPAVRDVCRRRFNALGISTERLDLHGVLASKYEHLGFYRALDIGLDTFPYNGTTTTCEALWMGIPVITLAGDQHVSRVGASLLNAVGLPQLVADDRQAYVDLAITLATDAAMRQQCSASLREKMSDSSLCDGAGYARNIEAAYRDMWTQWCSDIRC